MLNKLETHVQIGRSLQRQLYGNFKHILAKERHPGRAVGLLEVSASRQRRAAVKDPDIVQTEEPSFEHVAAGAILAVYPPGEVQEQLLEGALKPIHVTPAAPKLFQTVGEDGGPGMDWRVNIAEVPFVGR